MTHCAVVYCARRPLRTNRVTLEAGEPFPFQDKFSIKGLGAAYGVPDADRRPFAALPYVRAVFCNPSAAPPGCPTIPPPAGARIVDPPPWRAQKEAAA